MMLADSADTLLTAIVNAERHSILSLYASTISREWSSSLAVDSWPVSASGDDFRLGLFPVLRRPVWTEAAGVVTMSDE